MSHTISTKNEVHQLIKLIQKERNKLESFFIGLPIGSVSLIKSLITLADPITGIVNNTSYHELAQLLLVNPASGRKNTGMPTKQTIRNYIKLVEAECGDHFKVITKGQKLQFLFPDLPKLLERLVNSVEVNIEEYKDRAEENTAQSSESNLENNTELNTEHDIEGINADYAVKNINILNINNKNNNNNNTHSKQPISAHFTPSAETIAHAMTLGYTTAADLNEIQEFIAYNQAIGSQWVDFNFPYLRWLMRKAERKQHQQLKPTTRNNPYEQTSPSIKRSKTPKESLAQRVVKAWSDKFDFCETSRRFVPHPVHATARSYSDFMAAIS